MDQLPRLRTLSILFLAVFFQYTCGNAINPILAPLAARTGMSVVQTGLFFTLSSLVWLIASPFWGRQSERRGRVNVMVIGLVSCFILYALFGIVADWGLTRHPSPLFLFSLLLLIRIASGFFFSTVPVAAQAYIADTTCGMERTRSISLVWMASGLGSIAECGACLPQ
ncbi:MFS transporter [Ferroacidibacillus organovorans]|uniref:MFS transporter n=1 Tax=Ferroacidibacillus organovorans TaxID=1765683 RepID=UPI001365B348|nr:MFS transporter [Ferroacidibacillus organovorans]